MYLAKMPLLRVLSAYPIVDAPCLSPIGIRSTVAIHLEEELSICGRTSPFLTQRPLEEICSLSNPYASYDAMGNMTCRNIDTTSAHTCATGGFG
jgi:hypothetical protein